MRKAALLAAALGLGAGAFLPGSDGHSARQIAQGVKAQAERQADRSGGPARPNTGDMRFSSIVGGRAWGAPNAGGYRKRPRGTHKQNRRVLVRLNAKRGTRG